jgi:hypothetical protein
VAPYATLPQPNTTYVDPRCDGGQSMNSPDTRFPEALPNAPYQITKYVPYDQIHGAFKACDNGAYVGDPLHRFYQMNQQTNQNQNKLWVWTAETESWTTSLAKSPSRTDPARSGCASRARSRMPPAPRAWRCIASSIGVEILTATAWARLPAAVTIAAPSSAAARSRSLMLSGSWISSSRLIHSRRPDSANGCQ